MIADEHEHEHEHEHEERPAAWTGDDALPDIDVAAEPDVEVAVEAIADGEPARSVFGQHLDDDLAGRLAAVEVDAARDLLPEVEAAAVAALHLGVSLLGALGETGRDGAGPARAVLGRAASALTATPVTSSLLLARDTRARRAFILGGPRALTGGANTGP